MNQTPKNIISGHEVAVLNCLGGHISNDSKTIEVSEISYSTGIRDNDEILRALYTLEGKSMVAPEPRGDFTSNHWQITEMGKKALSMVAAG